QGVKSALMQRSAQFTAADKVLRSSQPFDPAVIELAQQNNLATAQQMQFDSMLFAGDSMQLATIKAVSSSYPLRGELLLKKSENIGSGEDGNLEPGSVHIEERLFNLLGIAPGDKVEIGMLSLTVNGVITNEPDAPLSVFGGAPRVLMHLDD